MIVDSSALLALVFEEPEASRVEEVLVSQDQLGIGAPTLAETGIVLGSRLGSDAEAVLARLVEGLDLAIIPFSALHGRAARRAFLRFGRGRHPAALNFGDCLTYAVAELAGQPLLFVGDDFSKTDLVSVLVGG